MTITYVAAGASVTGNNASLTPALPAGIAVGDLLLVVASIRNSGTGTVNVPAGWAPVATSGNLAVLGRWNGSGVTAPTITFAGGVANADTIARCVAFRGVSPDALAQSVSAAQLNGSAQNVAFPALDVPEDAYGLLMALWKQDDATSLTTPAGWTAVGLTSTTTGDDALQALFYEVQTAEADISAGSSTVTGGASAISRGLLLALKPAASVVVNEQDVWPPRAQIVVTGLTIGDSVTVYRVVAGQRTELRGAADAITDTAYVVTDAELPFGVPVSYVVVAAGTAEYATASVTYTLTGGKIAITDAITGLAAEVLVGAAGDMSNGRDSARIRVGGRNVVVMGPAGQDEGSYELFVESTTAYDNLIALLENATEGVVQLRQPGGYDGLDAYLAVDAWTTRRWLQDGQKQERLVTIEFAETESWALILTARSFTLQDLANAYTAPNDTLADLANDYATLLDLAQGDFS
jgi:hypothetical protein